MKKKLQIFISSTYKDLQDERQAAVEAILASNNIPAGMELFKAGNNSQWETIKKWINDSDIYMLILGGRYGSIESESRKSYTQLEYEYAISHNIPVFATVLSEAYITKKEQCSSNPEDIREHDNRNLYEEFKKKVMNKMIKIVDDCKDIKLAIFESISELKEEYEFDGWVRGINNGTYSNLVEQNSKYIQEIKELKEKQKNTEFDREISRDLEFWNREIILNVKGMEEFMGNLYEDHINLTVDKIFSIIAPLIMVPMKFESVKEDFEQSVKEIYEGGYYSLHIEDNQFQNIKVLLCSKKLIQVSRDSKNAELLELTQLGKEVLFER